MTKRTRRVPAPQARRAVPLVLTGSAAPSAAASRMLARGAVALAALLGAALLAMVLGPHRIGDYFTETDFYGAYSAGAGLIQHGHLDPGRYGVVGPVYEAALALAGLVVHDLFFAAELLSIAASVASFLLWFRLLERRCDARLGLGAALFMAFNPTFFRYGYAATTDALALALQAGALFALLGSRGRRAALLAGALSGLAFLTRYNAVYLLPAGLAAIMSGATLAASPAGSALDERRQRWHSTLRFAAGFAAPVVPWVIYCLANGTGFSFQLHHNIAYDVYARAQGMAWDDYQKKLQPQFKTLWDVIARDPGAVARRMLFNLGDHLRLDASTLLGWPTAAAAVAGVLFAWRDGTLRKLWPLLLGGALLFLTLVPVFYSERYSLPLLPIYASLAAAAFASPLLALAVGRQQRLWLKPVLALIALALSLQTSVKVQARVIDQLPTEVLDAGRTLRQLARAGDRVISRKGHIGYYGGIETVGFPFADSLAQLADYARREHARWLFMSWPEAELRPGFWYLLDTSGVVPGLIPRRVTPRHPAVLYEIAPEFGRAPDWISNDTLVLMHKSRALLMVDTTQVQAMFILAVYERNRHHLAEARLMLERILRQRGGDVKALLLLGETALVQGDVAAGMAAFDRAETLDPSNPDARIGRGWSRVAAGQLSEAAELWRPVVTVTQDPGTLERMVQLYRSLGDPQTAAQAESVLKKIRGGAQ